MCFKEKREERSVCVKRVCVPVCGRVLRVNLGAVSDVDNDALFLAQPDVDKPVLE